MERNIKKRILNFILVVTIIICNVIGMSLIKSTNSYANNKSFGPYPQLPLSINPSTDAIIIFDDRSLTTNINNKAVYMYVLTNGINNKFRTNQIPVDSIRGVNFRVDTPRNWEYYTFDPTVNTNWVYNTTVINGYFIDMHKVNSWQEAKQHIRYTNINFYSNNTFTEIWIPANTWNIEQTIPIEPNNPIEPFNPLEPAEAKELLKFIANVPDSTFWINIEQELPEYYALLTGTIQDPEEELKIKISFLTYLYYCLDIQLAQDNKRIDIGTTYLMNWVGENNQTSTVIYDEIKDELKDNLQNTICKNANIPGISTSFGIITGVLDYGELVIHSLGSILAIQRVDDINYLRAYLKLLGAKYEGDIMYWELICEALIKDKSFGGNPEEMKKYGKYIFDIERSLSN